MGKYIGIDLGTTISVAAYIDENGNPQIIKNSKGNSEYLIPSAIYADDNGIKVGEAAKKYSVMDPNNYVALAKRHMGSTKVTYNVKGQELYPQDVSAQVLKYIVDFVEDSLNDKVLGAVITVPAYFKDNERTATNEAAKLIGLNILGNITEPSAAALAYGQSQNNEDVQYILVYDLGGGTFDISLLRFENNTYTVLNTGDDSEFGGADFDKIIVDWFSEYASSMKLDINEDLEAKQELVFAAEEAKKELSVSQETMIKLYVCGKKVTAILTRSDFNRMIEQKIEETIESLIAVVDKAGKDFDDIDAIMLVGGSTRIPLIADMIEGATGKKPIMLMNPDEAVAIGAAYEAARLARNMIESDALDKCIEKDNDVPLLKKEYTLTDCTSHGIGIVAINLDTNEEYNYILIDKSTPLPAYGEQDFVTVVENQCSLKIQITQGEFPDLAYTTIVGTTELKFAPKPKGSPVRAVIESDTNGLIHAYVIDLTDNKNLGELYIQRSGERSESELEKSRNAIAVLSKKESTKGILDIG